MTCIVLGAVLYWLLSTIGCCLRVSDFFKRLISMSVRAKACIVLGAVLYWLLSCIGCCLLLVAVYYWLLSTIDCCFRVSVFFLTPDLKAVAGNNVLRVATCCG